MTDDPCMPRHLRRLRREEAELQPQCLRLEAWKYHDPKAVYNQTFVNLFVPSISYNLEHIDMSTPTNKRQKGADGNAVGGAYGNRNMGAPPRSHPSNGNRLVYFSLFEQTGTSIFDSGEKNLG